MRKWIEENLSFIVRSGSVFQLLIYRIALLFLLFSVQRLGFYFFNQQLFDKVTVASMAYMMYGGIQFDLTAILYFNLIFIVLLLIPFSFRTHIVYQKVLTWFFVVTNCLALVMNSADIIYYRFALRRTTFGVLKEFENESGHLLKMMSQFVFTYWYVSLFLVILVAIFIWLVKRVQVSQYLTNNKVSFFVVNTLILCFVVACSIVGIRGGIGKHVRPITLSNASKYVENVDERAIVLNTPFSFFRSMEAKGFDRLNFYNSREELEQVYSPIHIPSDSAKFSALNVVVIIWESFGKEYTGFYNKHLMGGDYKGYTPFMDSLLTQSKVFYYSYANGRKSIDAMPSVLASIPSLQEPFVLSHYSGNKVKGLPLLLKEKGYYSAFFHGAPNGSMGFDAFAKQAGFDDYYGKDEYANNEDFDGTWGIWDEEFLSFFAEEMDGFKEPFLSTVFTVSSHDPFRLPERYEGKFPEGPLPIMHSIGYTDYCMKEFFKKVSKLSWYDNTLFVITADHASTSHDPTYNNMVGGFSIPVFFYRPNSGNEAFVDSSLIQQIDVMPSVLGYLGYDSPYLCFGHDVFDTSKDNFVINFRDGVYQFFEDDYLIQFDGKRVVGVYLFKEDYLMTHNLKNQFKEIELRAVIKIKAFMQQYNNRMIDNRLIVD